MSMIEEVKPFIQLLLRSPDSGEGWRRVSDPVAPIATMNCNKAPELFELDHDDNGFRIRLSERGQIVAKYL